MALKKCQECGHEISTKARACPHCGAPVTKEVSMVRVLTAVVFVLLFIGYLVSLEDRSSSKGPSSSGTATSQPQATDKSKRSATASTEAPLSSISWSEIDAIYNLKSKNTDLQKDEAWKRYKGKRVSWSGTVSSVSESFGRLSLQVKMNPDTFASDLLITLRDSQRSRALSLEKGDSVTFTGVLDRWGSLFPIALKDGEIL